ncbi:MAG TPA: VCBS repeat-containing protein, partial [Bryobacteraceae bacterium]|nr:VCBS repeat-containing protein [Bryobacteraceae bacterium]
DTSLTDGHTIATADLNGDGRDEVVAGFRGGDRSVYVYYSAGDKWNREVLDKAMGAAACAVTDLDGDKKPDITCIDSSRLKWYRNLGQ